MSRVQSTKLCWIEKHTVLIKYETSKRHKQNHSTHWPTHDFFILLPNQYVDRSFFLWWLKPQCVSICVGLSSKFNLHWRMHKKKNNNQLQYHRKKVIVTQLRKKSGFGCVYVCVVFGASTHKTNNTKMKKRN